jgi:hypothetical protein
LVALKADLYPQSSWPELQERCQRYPQIPYRALVKHCGRQIAYDFYKAVIALGPEWACLRAGTHRQAEVRIAAEGVELTEKHLPAPIKGEFYVYVLRCNNNSFYICQTDDLPRRWEQHRNGTGAQ